MGSCYGSRSIDQMTQQSNLQPCFFVTNLQLSQAELVTCLNPCTVLFRGPGCAVLLLWLSVSRTLRGLLLSSAKANAALSLWDVFSWSTKLYLEIWVFQPWRRTFVFTQNLRQDRRRCLVFGDATHMWFLAGYTEHGVESLTFQLASLYSTGVPARFLRTI